MPISEKAAQIQNQIINETDLVNLSLPEKVLYLDRIFTHLSDKSIIDLDTAFGRQYKRAYDLETAFNRVAKLRKELSPISDSIFGLKHVQYADIEPVSGQVHEICINNRLDFYIGLVYVAHVFKTVLNTVGVFLDTYRKELSIGREEIIRTIDGLRKALDNFIDEELDSKVMEARISEGVLPEKTLEDRRKYVKAIKRSEERIKEIRKIKEIRRAEEKELRSKIPKGERDKTFTFDIFYLKMASLSALEEMHTHRLKLLKFHIESNAR